MDLDGFKKVNDTLGHDSGDQLLVEVGQRLETSVREEDLIGRLGGDEFVIVFDEASSEEVEEITERLITLLKEPYSIKGENVKITPSVGISMYPRDGEALEELIKNADKAMYHAKSKGKGLYYFYQDDLGEGEQKKFPMFEKIMASVSRMKNRG
ncbi:MAG: GGDEF domain-containing protein [Bacillus sp. (in: Bacteria)]|nr:GGDEF domain-containing protein [Bacillus sp. (in: firmicutes)]